MLDPRTHQPLEPEFSEPVSEVPGAMPGESSLPDRTVKPPTIPTPRPGPPPPSLTTPRPTLNTPSPTLPRLEVEPPTGLVYTPMAKMGTGHAPAPASPAFLQRFEAHLLIGAGAMAIGFILTGGAGMLGLWWVMRDELVHTLLQFMADLMA